jgi:hypothetical protein
MTVEPEVIEQKAEELDEESKQLAPIWTPPPLAEFAALERMATAIADTQMIPPAYRKKPADVLAVFLKARELGLAPMFALNHIFVIEGTPGLSANLIGALIRRARHRMQTLESTDKQARIWGRRRDTGDEVTVTWTIEIARRNGLLKKSNWNYIESMLVARATSQLGRELFQDVTMGIVYTPDELEDIQADAFKAPPQGQVERKSGDRQEEPTHAPPPTSPNGNGERYIDQPEREALKALAKNRQLSTEQLMAIVREAYESFNDLDDRARKGPFSNLRAKHADFIRRRLTAPPPDPDDQPLQTEIPTE